MRRKKASASAASARVQPGNQAQKYGAGAGGLDGRSAAAGIVAGAFIVALLFFAYPYLGPQPVAACAQANPQAGKQPAGLQPGNGPAAGANASASITLGIKNSGNSTWAVLRARAGNSTLSTLTGEIAAGGTASAGISLPAECAGGASGCLGQLVLTYYVERGGAGTDGSGGGNLSGGNPPAGGQEGQGSAPSPLAVATYSLPWALQDATYEFALEASGGTGNYSWVSSGLPSGLSLSQRGLISGAALSRGDFPVGIIVDDGASAAYAELVLQVG